MTAKGYRTLGFLKRNLRVNSPTLKAKAYASILRLQLKYGSTVWDPRKGVENNGSYNLEKGNLNFFSDLKMRWREESEKEPNFVKL